MARTVLISNYNQITREDVQKVLGSCDAVLETWTAHGACCYFRLRSVGEASRVCEKARAGELTVGNSRLRVFPWARRKPLDVREIGELCAREAPGRKAGMQRHGECYAAG